MSAPPAPRRVPRVRVGVGVGVGVRVRVRVRSGLGFGVGVGLAEDLGLDHVLAQPHAAHLG